MTVQLQSRFRVTQNGEPVPFAKVYTYKSGTTTPQATYTNPGLTIANANPVICDANGEAVIFLREAVYTVVAKTSSGSTVWTQDGISGAYLTTDQLDSRYVRAGETTFVNAVTRDVIGGVRTYLVELTGIDAYDSGQILGIIPDVVLVSDTGYQINLNGLGDVAYENTLGAIPSLESGKSTVAVYDGAKFVQETSVSLLANQSSVELVNDGGAEPCRVIARVNPGIHGELQIEATYGGGDPTLALIADSIDIRTTQDENATVNGETIATRTWIENDSGIDPDSTSDAILDGSERIAVKQSGAWLRTTASSLESFILRDQAANIKEFGAVGDGVTDDTSSIQSALDSGAVSIYVPDGTYIVTTVTIGSSVSIFGSGSFKRKDNYETDNTSAGDANNTMFDVTAHVSVSFEGITFDGNESNQNVNTPSGALIRAYDVDGSSDSTLSINADGCSFINITRSAITVKGKISGLGEEIATVTNCLFKDSRPGIGAGDPSSSNASGFAPTFINVNDRARLIAKNNRFIYTGSVSTGDYAPTGIRFTYVDGTTNEDGSRGIVEGNYFYRCGRSDVGYTGTPNANNGLGVVEAYTIGQDISVSNNTFDTSYSACVRAKSSCSGVVVTGNILTKCQEAGVSIGPMGATNGTQTGKIVVTSNVIKSADAVGIVITGDNTVSPSEISDIIIADNHVSEITNVFSVTGNVGGISIRYASRVAITGNVIDGVPDSNLVGIRVRDCTDAIVCNNSVQEIGSHGVYVQRLGGQVAVSSNMIKSVGGDGVVIDSTGSPDCVVTGNVIDTAVSYGCIVFDARYLTINSNIALNISGSSRGFYVPATVTRAEVIGNVTNATTPLFYTTGGNVHNSGNSWNAAEDYRTSAPSSGTWVLGDRVWNKSPAAGGTPGWVCVVGGSPGTWKAMANLAS